MATGGCDGAVRVWDTRQRNSPVAAFLPGDKDMVRHKLRKTAKHRRNIDCLSFRAHGSMTPLSRPFYRDGS